MRYWAFFVGKLLCAVAALSQGIYLIIALDTDAALRPADVVPRSLYSHDLWFTAEIGIWFLITCGMIYAAIWDQRYRCRVLPAPPAHADRDRSPGAGCCSSGRPEIEYICVAWPREG